MPKLIVLSFKEWLEILEEGALYNQAQQMAVNFFKNSGNTDGQQWFQELVRDIPELEKSFPALVVWTLENNNPQQVKRLLKSHKQLENKVKPLEVRRNGNWYQVYYEGRPVTFLKFAEIIHAKEGQARWQASNKSANKQAEQITDPPIFDNNNITIYEAHGREKCIKYGKGYSFCISQPNNTMWQSYRDSTASTFYFVFDKNRPKDDPLHIVVVDAVSMGDTKFRLTDADNNTGKIAEFGENVEAYMQYLRSRGVDTNIFKNIPHTEEEQRDKEKLGQRNGEIEWFKQLTHEEKSKYIGRGHYLTDQQFDYLMEHKLDDLLQQYVGIGHMLSDEVLEKLRDNNQLLRTYLRSRIQMAQAELNEGSEYYKLTEKENILLTKFPDLVEMAVKSPLLAYNYGLAWIAQNAYHANRNRLPMPPVPDVLVDGLVKGKSSAISFANELAVRRIPVPEKLEAVIFTNANNGAYYKDSYIAYLDALINHDSPISKEAEDRIASLPAQSVLYAVSLVEKGKDVPEKILRGVVADDYDTHAPYKAFRVAKKYIENNKEVPKILEDTLLRDGDDIPYNYCGLYIHIRNQLPPKDAIAVVSERGSVFAGKLAEKIIAAALPLPKELHDSLWRTGEAELLAMNLHKKGIPIPPEMIKKFKQESYPADFLASIGIKDEL